MERSVAKVEFRTPPSTRRAERADLARKACWRHTSEWSVSLSEPCSSHLGSGTAPHSHLEGRGSELPCTGAAVFSWFCSSMRHVRWDRLSPQWEGAPTCRLPTPWGGECLTGSRRAVLHPAGCPLGEGGHLTGSKRAGLGLTQWEVSCPDLVWSGSRALGLRTCIAKRGTGPMESGDLFSRRCSDFM